MGQGWVWHAMAGFFFLFFQIRGYDILYSSYSTLLYSTLLYSTLLEYSVVYCSSQGETSMEANRRGGYPLSVITVLMQAELNQPRPYPSYVEDSLLVLLI